MGHAIATLLLAFGGEAAAPRTLADFFLAARDASRHGLYAEREGRVATVIAFVEPGDPASLACAEAMAAGAGDEARAGVTWLAISATAGSKAGDAAVAALETALGGGRVPLLLDPDLVVAADAGVARSGTLLLLDAAFGVVYRGPADDRFDGKALAAAATNEFLVNALDSFAAGEEIDPAEVAENGADLWSLAPKRKVTFHRDVAPVLFDHCAICHRPNQPGPMELLDYDDAQGWAPQIAEAALSARMPPWFADPRHGSFKNQRRLTETEKRTLALFAEGGAVAGDPKEAPPTPVFADPEWRIAEPDVVIELPEPQPIPAEGVVLYRYVAMDPGFTEDQWIQACDVKPTAPAATHHVIAYLLPRGMSKADALRDPTAVLSLKALGGWAPGTDPMDLPDGRAILVRAGSTLLFELHYSPNGTATTDRTRVAFRRTRVPVQQVLETGAVMKFNFRIPPHKPDATFTASHKFRGPARLLSLTPHMHLRGKAMRYELVRGGTRRTLLDVPAYDFNWQLGYDFAQPVDAQPGDELLLTAVFDNSRDNKHNPNPGATVTWGDQSFEEMMIGYFDWLDPNAPPPAGKSTVPTGAGAEE